MKPYVGQTRSKALIAELLQLGWGEMITPREVPPRRWQHGFALDNGVFPAWKASLPWDVRKFEWALVTLRQQRRVPDFVVLPDWIAAGRKSLELSLSWIPRLKGYAPLYLAVQDGMSEDAVWRELELSRGRHVNGLFVGGSLKWKMATAEGWVHLAHAYNLKCHIGRMHGYARARWAKQIGADSIDSSAPLISRTNLERFKRGCAFVGEEMDGPPKLGWRAKS